MDRKGQWMEFVLILILVIVIGLLLFMMINGVFGIAK
jgi:hypothetical protein